MSLIEKIDAEIVRLEKERDLFPRWINPEKHDEADAAVKEAYRIREIIISEQKEPCEYCKVYSELPLPLTSKRLSIKVKHCPNCGRPINQSYTEE